MIFDVHGKVLGQRLEARSFRNRPRLQHTVDFEPEIVVQARGVVTLDAEVIAFGLARDGLGGRLRSLVERSLARIFLQGLGGTRHNSRLPVIWMGWLAAPGMTAAPPNLAGSATIANTPAS